jgi:hypothetical protein
MALPSLTRFALFLQEKPSGAIIIDVTEPPKSELSALSDVLLGSLGLSGFLGLTAILLGIGVGWLVFWIKRRIEE